MSKKAKRSAPIQIVYSHAGRKGGSRGLCKALQRR